jgi:hypothetical protein
MKSEPQPVFAALADPTRRALLLNLAGEGPKTATRLAREHPGMTRHLCARRRRAGRRACSG